MHLQRGEATKKLRFNRPVEVKVDIGFQGQISGMKIMDVSQRQWDDIGVDVRNFEQDPGITFKAYNVVEIE